MTTATTRRSRTLPGVVLVALSVLAAAPAASSDVFTAAREWNPRQSHVLESLTALPASATGSKRPVALRRLQPKFSATNGFYEAYLAPRLSARLRDQNSVAAADSADPASNPWTKDPAAVEHVEKQTIRAIKSAFERYAIERLGIDRWSLPVTGWSGRGGAARANDSRGARLRFGFSSLAPRADLLIPVTAGRVVVSADARGRIGTTFEPTSSRLRLAADVDVPEHTATFRLSLRF